MSLPVTGEIFEMEAPGAYSTILPPCSCRILPRVLHPGPGTYIWLLRHMPHPTLEWVELPVPLFSDGGAQTLRVRNVQYEAQIPLLAFLALLPQYPERDGVLLLQMTRPVPDSFDYFAIRKSRNRHRILQHFGWLLTVDLPFGGEYAQLISPDRTHLERVLADEVIAAGLAAGELP